MQEFFEGLAPLKKSSVLTTLYRKMYFLDFTKSWGKTEGAGSKTLKKIVLRGANAPLPTPGAVTGHLHTCNVID